VFGHYDGWCTDGHRSTACTELAYRRAAVMQSPICGVAWPNAVDDAIDIS